MQENLAISPAVPPEPAGDAPVDIDQGVDFLLDLFGDDQFGFVVLAFIDPGDPGRIKHENIRLTSPERAQIARRIIERYAPTHDCYLGAANYATDFSPRDANRYGSGGYAYRTKQMVGHCRWAFCDRDRHPLSPDLPAPTFIVETSIGSYQDQGLCVLASEALRRGSRLIFLTPNPLPSEGRGSNAAPR